MWTNENQPCFVSGDEMTIQECIDLMPTDGWMISYGGEILRQQPGPKTFYGYSCPITSITEEHASTYKDVSKKLGLSLVDAVKIASAADLKLKDCPTNEIHALRLVLLECFNLLNDPNA